jgi:hypothetical protein
MRQPNAQPVRFREASWKCPVSARVNNPYSGTLIRSQSQEEARESWRPVRGGFSSLAEQSGGIAWWGPQIRSRLPALEVAGRVCFDVPRPPLRGIVNQFWGRIRHLFHGVLSYLEATIGHRRSKGQDGECVLSYRECSLRRVLELYRVIEPRKPRNAGPNS